LFLQLNRSELVALATDHYKSGNLHMICGVLIEATASMYIKLDFYKYFFFNISSVFSKCIRAPSHQKMHYCHLQGPRNLQRASTLKFQLKATKDCSHLRENA